MLVVLLAAGSVCAQDMDLYRMMRRGCPALRTARDLLGLDEDQGKQARDLADRYRNEVRAEVEKAQAELIERLEKAQAGRDEKFTLEMVGMLNDEQKEQFEALVAAEEAYIEAVTAANEEYRSTLLELFYGDTDDEGKALGRRRMMRLPKKEAELLPLYSMADSDFRLKFAQVQTRNATAIGNIHSQARKIDRKDTAALKEWQKERPRLLKEQAERYKKEARELLDEEQSAVFAQSVDAQNKWKKATKAAETAYTEAAQKVVGPGKERQIKAHQRRLSVVSRTFCKFRSRSISGCAF